SPSVTSRVQPRWKKVKKRIDERHDVNHLQSQSFSLSIPRIHYFGVPLYQQKAIKTGRTEHQDAKMTSMRPLLKELNDIPYI
ncbi:MAG: hypothetical protein MR924_03185, partial [Prevotella sp.]|nr:hypothetical protein [Prevotella sp.]